MKGVTLCINILPHSWSFTKARGVLEELKWIGEGGGGGFSGDEEGSLVVFLSLK